MNGMITCVSSFVAGSYMSLTSFLTTSGATFAGNTSSNISTIALVASSFWSRLYGRYIIERESPYTANEKPDAGCFVAGLSSATAAGPAISVNRAINADITKYSFVVWLVCFIFYFLSLIGSSVHGMLNPGRAVL